MALSAMGKEIKVTDGIINSKSGFQGDITTYQISAPIQGGNSGGPLFDDKGNFIGDLRSACYSPHFKKVIGIAMINEPYCKPSTTGLLEIEGNSLAVKVCDLPFI